MDLILQGKLTRDPRDPRDRNDLHNAVTQIARRDHGVARLPVCTRWSRSCRRRRHGPFVGLGSQRVPHKSRLHREPIRPSQRSENTRGTSQQSTPRGWCHHPNGRLSGVRIAPGPRNWPCKSNSVCLGSCRLSHPRGRDRGTSGCQPESWPQGQTTSLLPFGSR